MRRRLAFELGLMAGLVRARGWRERVWLARLLWRSRLDARFGARDVSGAPAAAAPAAASIPRRIWLYWAQGWNEAPELVLKCRDSWRYHNPGWEVACLDRDSAETLTGMPGIMAGKEVAPTGVANMIRLALLARDGGVWADATAYCARPLDDWLSDVTGSGFFAFARPGPDRLVATWFLASSAGHPVLGAWLERAVGYWRAMRRPHLYFWVHHLFADAVRHDRACHEAWARTPRVPADPALQLQKIPMAQWQAALDAANLAGVPVHKLDWRLDLDEAAGLALLGAAQTRRV